MIKKTNYPSECQSLYEDVDVYKKRVEDCVHEGHDWDALIIPLTLKRAKWKESNDKFCAQQKRDREEYAKRLREQGAYLCQ